MSSSAASRTGSAGNILAGLCSFFIPGLGQLLQGRLLAAIVFFVLAASFWVVMIGWLVHLISVWDAATYDPDKRKPVVRKSFVLVVFGTIFIGLVASVFVNKVNQSPRVKRSQEVAKPVSPSTKNDSSVNLPAGQIKVSRDEFGERWPFVVSEGVLECEKGSRAVTFAAMGKVFALNGTARTRGYEDVLPIWLHNPDNQELRVSTRDVLNKALALCD